MNISKNTIKQFKNGNEEAFNIIYYNLNKLVHHVIFQIVKNTDIAEELTNETFMVVYEKRNQHDETKNFKYWVLTIAKNNALEYLRKNKNYKIIYDSDYINTLPDETKESDFIYLCCKVLNDEEFQVLTYKLVLNMKFVDIANLTGVSKSTAHRIYLTAVQKMSEVI